MSDFHAMGNVVLATMEASVELGYQEQNDLLSTSNIAITLSTGLSSLMDHEQTTLSEIMTGGYSGIFDANNPDNDPGFAAESSNDNAVPMTQACLSAAQSGFQGWISTLTSVLSSMTQAIQSSQQNITQTFQFPDQAMTEQTLMTQLLSTSMTA